MAHETAQAADPTSHHPSLTSPRAERSTARLKPSCSQGQFSSSKTYVGFMFFMILHGHSDLILDDRLGEDVRQHTFCALFLDTEILPSSPFLHLGSSEASSASHADACKKHPSSPSWDKVPTPWREATRLKPAERHQSLEHTIHQGDRDFLQPFMRIANPFPAKAPALRRLPCGLTAMTLQAPM